MSVFNVLRGLFGPRQPPSDGEGPSRQDNVPAESPNQFRNPIWSQGDDDDDDDDFRSRPRQHFGFTITTDPIEMNRFFEQQMEELIRSFHQGFGGFFESFHQERALPEPKAEGRNRLRDKFLKPGYEKHDSRGHMCDSDLDDKVFSGNLGKILQDKLPLEGNAPSRDALTRPNSPGLFNWGSSSLLKPETSTQFFSRSIVSKTVRRPDGAVEHHRTVKDAEGNEETTVTRQVGDQSYSVTTRVGPSGQQECIKNFINMDEDNLQDFEKKWGSKL